jgi:hypothetical protein
MSASFGDVGIDLMHLGGCGCVQMSQNWCQNVNFFATLVTFVYVVPC